VRDNKRVDGTSERRTPMTLLQEIEKAELKGEQVFIVYYSNDNEDVMTLTKLYQTAQKHYDGNVWVDFEDDINELISWIMDCFPHVESIDPVVKILSSKSELVAA
jgi:hypothetical protein